MANSLTQWIGVLVALIVVAIISFGVVTNSSYTHKSDELAKRAHAIEAGFLVMRSSLGLREAEIGQTHSIANKFGTVRAVDSQRLLEEGDALLTQMLGDTVRGLIQRKAAPADQSYDLVLVECPLSSGINGWRVLLGLPANQLQVGMAIQASVLPNLAAKDAHTLIKALPCPLLEGVSRLRAEDGRRALETAGAKAEVRPTATASAGQDRHSGMTPTMNSEFEVILVAIPAQNKAAIKKALNKILVDNPALTEKRVLAKAKGIDEGVPNCLFTGIPETLANTVRDTLVSAGAEVKVQTVK